MRKVKVVSFHEEWACMFEKEADQLHAIFGSELVAIHHIGSTSIPGLKAKPVIDMMPVVRDITIVDEWNAEMKAIGYQPKGEHGMAGRRYFEKGGDQRTHHVHIYQTGNQEIVRHLAFRDFLRAHLEAKEEYGSLKERLADQFPYDIDNYIKGKEKLVSEIESKALRWYSNT